LYFPAEEERREKKMAIERISIQANYVTLRDQDRRNQTSPDSR